MFKTRDSKAWGAGGEIRRDYLLELMNSDDVAGLAIFKARSKSDGVLYLLKCQLNHAEEVLLSGEADIWNGLNHPNIMSPSTISRADDKPFFVYPWHGEAPLTSVSSSELSSSDRLRIALGLIRAVDYLQNADPPVAHTRIAESVVWVSQANRWPRITGFEHAVRPADDELLEQDRRDCWQAIQRIISMETIESQESRLLEAAGSWMSEGTGRVIDLQQELDRAFVASVTSGL